MVFVANGMMNSTVEAIDVVSDAIASFKRLSTDDQLGLLWVIYENMGGAITPAAPGAARLQFAEGLLNQVKALSFNEQLHFMRDLVNQVNTSMTRAYGLLSNNNKLAFWYQLGEWMRSGLVIPVPSQYELSADAKTVYERIASLDFGQQISILRQSVVAMGIDPLFA